MTPRVGAAWDVKGNQQFVVRGGAGLFYDRAPANSVYGTVSNPPFTRNVTVRYGELQNMSSTGLATEAPPALTVWQYDNKLAASTQWNLGVQMALPFAAALDVAYAGQHSFDANTGVNINAIDLGAAFLPVYQNPALATSASSTDPATSYVSSNPDLIRFYRGYAAINQQQPIGWRTYHSIQIALNRRFRNGLLFGFNDTIGLSDMQSAALRLQHNADGTITVRADQAKADELLGDNHPQAHLMRAHFVWNLPKVPASTSTWRVIGAIVNDWSLSGIWSGASGTAYSTSATYQSGGGNVNLTGSPDFAPRVQVVSDPGAGCSSDPLRQFNDRRVPRAARRQRRARIGQRLPHRVLHQQPGPGDCAHDQAGRHPQPAVAGRRVQHLQPGRHHRAADADEPLEPERPGNDHQSAVRRRRQRHPVARAAQRRGLRGRHRLSAAAQRAAAAEV